MGISDTKTAHLLANVQVSYQAAAVNVMPTTRAVDAFQLPNIWAQCKHTHSFCTVKVNVDLIKLL